MHILFAKDWNTTAKKTTALIKRKRVDDMDIIKTRAFYEQVAEPHFVIEAYPIRLKWVMQSSAKKRRE